MLELNFSPHQLKARAGDVLTSLYEAVKPNLDIELESAPKPPITWPSFIELVHTAVEGDRHDTLNRAGLMRLYGAQAIQRLSSLVIYLTPYVQGADPHNISTDTTSSLVSAYTRLV